MTEAQAIDYTRRTGNPCVRVEQQCACGHRWPEWRPLEPGFRRPERLTGGVTVSQCAECARVFT